MSTTHVELFAARGFADTLDAQRASYLASIVGKPDVLAAVIEQINFNNGHFTRLPNPDHVALFQAFKYALGRMSAAVSIVSEEIEKEWTELDTEIQSKIQEMIAESIEENRAGQPCDIAAWRNILELPVGNVLKMP